MGSLRSHDLVDPSVAAAGATAAVVLAAASVRSAEAALAVAGLALLVVALPGRRAGATALLLPLCLLPHGIRVGDLWVSASDVLVMVLGALLLLERATGADRGPLLGPLAFPAVAFVAWTAASSLWAADPTAALVEAVQRFGFVVVGVALVAALPRDGRHVRLALLGFVGGAAVLGTVTVLTGVVQGRYLSVYAAGMHKNAIGYLLSMALVAAVAWGLAPPGRHPARRWVVPAGGLILAGLIMSGSRGGWVGAVVALAVVLILRRPHAVTAVAVSAVLAVTALTLLVPPDVVSDRAGFDTPHSAADVRAQTWGQGLESITSEPLLGIGAGNFRASVRRQGVQVDPNNLLLLTWAETGVPGLLLLLGLLGGCLGLAWRRARRLPSHGTATTASLAGAGMLVAAVAHAQLDMFWSRGTALAAFLGVGLVLWAHHHVTDRDTAEIVAGVPVPTGVAA